MVQVWVQLISPLSNQVGWREKEYAGDSISDIIAQLQGDFPDNIRENFFEGDPPILKPYMLIFLNNKDIQQFDGMETVLNNGDIVQIAIALGGG